MLEQLIVSGLSGALIIFYFLGLGVIFKILKEHRDEDLSWKDSFKNNVKGFKMWLLFFFSLFVTVVIVLGMGASIVFG